MKKMTYGCALLSWVIVLLGCGAAVAADPADYVGVKSCKICHKSPEKGDQFGVWSKTAHAEAYTKLASPEAKAAGEKVGVADPQTSAKCLKCHSTAYNFSEVAPAADSKVTLEEGVSCESCHGAGKNYKAKEVMTDKAAAKAAGLMDPGDQNCVKCHNEESPSWKADRYTTKDGKQVGFDLEQAFEKIKHPLPKK